MSPDSASRNASRPAQPCQSLPHAIRAIAETTGGAIDLDALCAAMGLSLMVPAVSDEPDLAAWPRYARDAFLIAAGRLFRLTIRAMHPPEAARGLPSSEEFRQHFDASYCPLVLRALEHDQPVLAWQGWPGAARLHWGIITRGCDEGIGLAGRLYGYDAESKEQVLERPPVQLYVVETIENRPPDVAELAEAFLVHARIVSSDALHTRFGVTMGPAAYDLWVERLRDAGAGDPAAVRSHHALAASAIAGHQSAARFMTQVRPHVTGENGDRLDAISPPLSAIIEFLTTAHGTVTGSLALTPVTEALTRARDATAELTALLALK